MSLSVSRLCALTCMCVWVCASDLVSVFHHSLLYLVLVIVRLFLQAKEWKKKKDSRMWHI